LAASGEFSHVYWRVSTSFQNIPMTMANRIAGPVKPEIRRIRESKR
jgi:hypothetical protein